MSKKPVIGIIGKVQPRKTRDLWNQISEVDEFRYLVVKHGGVAIMLLPSEETLKFNDNDIKDNTVLSKEELKDLYRQLELCDGFILQGGLYSCNYEIEMAKKILKMDKPLIGICAGFNNILRAVGTDVIVDETGSHNHNQKKFRHKVTVEPDTIIGEIIGTTEYDVNSIHTMVEPKEMAEGFVKIAACSEDGLVEAFEVPGKRFVLGIKWHPEIMLEDQFTDDLFERFIEEAGGKKPDKKSKDKGKKKKNIKADKKAKKTEVREDAVEDKKTKKNTKIEESDKLNKIKKDESTDTKSNDGESLYILTNKEEKTEKPEKEEVKKAVKELKKNNAKKMEKDARFYFALHNRREMEKILSLKH